MGWGFTLFESPVSVFCDVFACILRVGLIDLGGFLSGQLTIN